jgi:hypothetical protein
MFAKASALSLCAALIAAPASAHHSHAMYDPERMVLIEGTVKRFDWTNPHGWLYVTVMDESGQAMEWSLELGSTAALIRDGWRPRIVVPGDAVKVALLPLKENLQALSEEGRNVGALMAITLPDGSHIGDAAHFQ